MINMGKLARRSGFCVGGWRWPLIVGIPVLAGSLLAWRGFVRLHYEGQLLLGYSGAAHRMDSELKRFRSHAAPLVSWSKVPGQPRQMAMHSEGSAPAEVIQRLTAASQACIAQSHDAQEAELLKVQSRFQENVLPWQSRFTQLSQDRKALPAGPKTNTPRAGLVAKIEELKARRRQLIDHYPTHTDIPVLAKQIQDLVRQRDSRTAPAAGKVTDLDRQINEAKVRLDYFSRRLNEAAREARALKLSWKVVQPAQKPKWPNRVEGWPLGVGVVSGLFVFCLAVLKKERRAPSAAHGLWRPQAPEAAVQLEVVSPETTAIAPAQAALPSDPLTEKAAELYAKWVEVAKVLYTPAPEPPQGVLDSVGPLLQESSDFLPDGHEVLARYLAKSVTPGDLAAHVARTVLMTLTGAEEAGVSPEHRLGMALAALFHDLAVVPRPAAIQEEVGSEVGRLSASILRRIPGLQPALLSMVEEILIGMDEFKLETWQNVASGSNLEPLSKVLREIDRFEKVMQKQKSRLDRRVANS